MFNVMLFLHLTGLLLWFGSSMANAVVLLLSKRHIAADETKSLVRNMIRVSGWLTYPGSILVLVSGIVMIVQMNIGESAKPLWLNYMEKGGGTIVMVSIALTAVLGERIVKRLGSAGQIGSGSVAGSGLYVSSLFVIQAAIVSVLLVVGLRL
ncbi:DUF2269 family protein [Paenibacillus thermotolerans]|uniref:DUF2269 family protein n=1 Tax=Paenibacillus thermotolerans TaxID=3027807 RepID=UPI002367D6EE|nr:MULTISPECIES: DUF2269 family protein [unclassified Paenibacillus]